MLPGAASVGARTRRPARRRRTRWRTKPRPGSRPPRPDRRTGTRRRRGRRAGRSRHVAAGQVERAAATVHHLSPAPGDALAPVLQGSVEQLLQPHSGLVGALAGTDRHLGLDELLARGRQRGVLSRVALEPAGASRGRRRSRDRHGARATRGRGRPCDRWATASVSSPSSDAGVAELQRDDHGSDRECIDPLAGDDLHAELAGAALERLDEARPPAHDEPRRRPRVEQQTLGALPHERRRQLARVVVEGVDAGQRRQVTRPSARRRGR